MIRVATARYFDTQYFRTPFIVAVVGGSGGRRLVPRLWNVEVVRIPSGITIKSGGLSPFGRKKKKPERRTGGERARGAGEKVNSPGGRGGRRALQPLPVLRRTIPAGHCIPPIATESARRRILGRASNRLFLCFIITQRRQGSGAANNALTRGGGRRDPRKSSAARAGRVRRTGPRPTAGDREEVAAASRDVALVLCASAPSAHAPCHPTTTFTTPTRV